MFPHNPRDCLDELAPAIAFAEQLPLPFSSKPVVLGALVGVALRPLGFHPPALLQSMERRVERPGLNLEHLGRLRPDRLTDPVSVLGPGLKRPQDRACRACLAAVPGEGLWSVWPCRQSTGLDVGSLHGVPTFARLPLRASFSGQAPAYARVLMELRRGRLVLACYSTRASARQAPPWRVAKPPIASPSDRERACGGVRGAKAPRVQTYVSLPFSPP